MEKEPLLPPGVSESDESNLRKPVGEWNSDSVFQMENKSETKEGGLWEATDVDKEPLARPSSPFLDPSLPALDSFD